MRVFTVSADPKAPHYSLIKEDNEAVSQRVREKILLAAKQSIVVLPFLFGSMSTVAADVAQGPSLMELRAMMEASNSEGFNKLQELERIRDQAISTIPSSSQSEMDSKDAISQLNDRLSSLQVLDTTDAVSIDTHESHDPMAVISSARKAVSNLRRGAVLDENASDLDKAMSESARAIDTFRVGYGLAALKDSMQNYDGQISNSGRLLDGMSQYQEMDIPNLKHVSFVIHEDWWTTIGQQKLSDFTAVAVEHVAGHSIDMHGLSTGDRVDFLYDPSRERSNPLQMLQSLSIEKTDGSVFTAIQFRSEDGTGSYFTQDGNPLRENVYNLVPVEGHVRLSSHFGSRVHPVTGRHSHHNGTDFAGPIGTPISAAADGVITLKAAGRNAGNYIIMDHDDGSRTVYMHLNRFASGLKEGDRVSKGDIIAELGNTGRSTGPHLHFEVRLRLPSGEYAAVNPVKFPVNDTKMDVNAYADFISRRSESLVAMGMSERAELLALHDRKQETLAAKSLNSTPNSSSAQALVSAINYRGGIFDDASVKPESGSESNAKKSSLSM